MHGMYILGLSQRGASLQLRDSQGEDGQEVCSLKEALRGFQQKQLIQQSFKSGKASEAGPEEPHSAPAQPAEAGQRPGARVMMGFVNSEAPRGLLGRGACGLCLGASISAQRTQQMPGKEDSGVLVAYRSPLSSVLRIAEARTVW